MRYTTASRPLNTVSGTSVSKSCPVCGIAFQHRAIFGTRKPMHLPSPNILIFYALTAVAPAQPVPSGSPELRDTEVPLSCRVLAIASGKGGAIVNVASNAGLMGQAYTVPYCASKGAVVNMTKAMAMEYVKTDIRINAVAPGTVQTPRMEAAWADGTIPKPTGETLERRRQSMVRGRQGGDRSSEGHDGQ